MPFYEYECRQCGAQTEVMQKISDRPLKKCPECGKNALVRLISAPVFRLKGSGWYETDFKGDQDRKRNLADSGSEPEAKESPTKEGATGGEAAGKTAEGASGGTAGSDAKATDTKASDAKASDPKGAAKEKSSATGRKPPARKPAARKPAARKAPARGRR